MPGIPSTELFSLIQSLSKSEKRYFKVFTSRHLIGDENKHIKLFDLIEKQSQYDENKVLKKAAITKQQLKGQKNFLYKLILRSLDVYHLEGNAEKKINQLIRHAKIILEKELYPQCLKLLVKAKQLAVKYEKHLLHVEILIMEGVALHRMYAIQKMEKHVENNFREREQAIEKLATIAQYEQLSAQQSLFLLKEGVARNSAYRKQFAAIAEHPLMKDNKPATSYRARLMYHGIKSTHQVLMGKLESSFHSHEERVLFIEKHPHQIAEDPFSYVFALQNLAAICFELGKEEKFMDILGKLWALPVKTANLQNKIFVFTYQMKLSYYNKYAQYQKGIGIIPEIRKGMERIGDKFDKHFQLHFYYNFAQSYFAVKEYRSALRWLNNILNDPAKELKKDIYCFARVMSLVIHYEMGNQQLLKSAVKSTYHFLSTHQRLFALETVILKFIRNKMAVLRTQKQILKAFQDLRKELIEITKDDFEKKALDYFDIISWLSSKIENRSFEEVMREKARELTSHN